MKRRQELVEDFNVPTSHAFVFLLSTKAGGAGFNLVGASRLVLMEPGWNPAGDAQVMGRVWRMGQRAERVVTYRLLSTATLEEVIFLRQLKKVDKQLAVFDEEGSGITAAELDDAELEELFAVGSRTWSLAFRGREEQRLDAPPHALLGGALDDGFVTHVHEEKGRADAGAEGV